MQQIQGAAVTVQGASEQSNHLAVEVDGRMKEELGALGEALNYSADLSGPPVRSPITPKPWRAASPISPARSRR